MSRSPWFALMIVSAGLFMVGVDMTVLNVALPTLARDLGATTSDKLWMVNAYSLVMAGLLPGFGTLSDRIGHRTILIAGLIVFGFSSLIASFAPNPAVLIAARGMLAIGAAMMMPATISIVRVLFTEDQSRAVAIGVWTSVWAGAAALGPIVGGFLLDHFWWGSVFIINVPVVILTLVLTITKIPHLPGNPGRHWDVLTSAVLTVALIAMLYAIKGTLKAQVDWIEVTSVAILGMVFAWWFASRQRGLPSPLIDFMLFRTPRFTVGTLLALFACFVLIGLQYVLSQELQLVRGYTPLQAGLFVLPLAAGSFVAGPAVGRYLFRIGVERMMAGTIAIATVAMGLYAALWQQSALLVELTLLTVIGFGLGAAMSAASTAIMISVPEDRAGMAGSIEAMSYELGGTLGVAIMGSVMAFVYASQFSPPAAAQLSPSAWDSLDQTVLAAKAADPGMIQYILIAGKAAFVDGATVTFIIGTVVLTALLSGLAVYAHAFKAVRRTT